MWWIVACGWTPSGAETSAEPRPLARQVEALAAVGALRTEPWRRERLTLTRHGRCRMQCRHFDRDEVEALLAEGRFVPERTRLDGRCPTHAVEGTTRDGQHARMVFAACADQTRLVTAIDLDTNWPCDCE